MTEHNQTQDNQSDLNKSQQPETGVAKQDQTEQTLNQSKAGQEERTFEAGQTDLEAKHANPDIETDAEVDDEDETDQANTADT